MRDLSAKDAPLKARRQLASSLQRIAPKAIDVVIDATLSSTLFKVRTTTADGAVFVVSIAGVAAVRANELPASYGLASEAPLADAAERALRLARDRFTQRDAALSSLTFS